VIESDNAGELWLDAKSDDVWALGASFYYLCTGKHVSKVLECLFVLLPCGCFFFQVATFQPGGSWSRSWKEVRQRKNRELACFPHVSVSGDEVSVP
jgi:hypothetical protein